MSGFPRESGLLLGVKWLNTPGGRVRSLVTRTAFPARTVNKRDDSSHSWWEKRTDGFERPAGDNRRISALRHLRTGCFEDFAFALGQALDTVRGDFIEYRVHFPADEF